MTDNTYEQRLRAVLDVVQCYLPPDGIAVDLAMSEIIALVDPWPAALPVREGVSQTVDDLAALVRRLAHALRKAAPGNDLAEQAVDYLHRQGLQGSPLRTAGAASPSDCPSISQDEDVLRALIQALPVGPNKEVAYDALARLVTRVCGVPVTLAECCPRCLRDGWVERESECKKHGTAGVRVPDPGQQ